MSSHTEFGRVPAKAGSMMWGAWMAAIPAGMILWGMVADSPFVAAMQSDRLFFACWLAIQIGALLAGVAIALGGTPVAWSALSEAIVRRRRDILLSFALPTAAVAALIGWMAAVVIWTGGRWAPLPWTVQFSNPGWPAENFRWITGSVTAALLILALTASAVGVGRILRRSSLQDVNISVPGANLTLAPLRFAGFLAPLATVGFVLMFGGVLAWGLEAGHNVAFHARLGPLGLTSAATWLISLSLFGVSVACSIRAARHPSEQQAGA